MNILSIKGGGARILIIGKFLVEIEKITQQPIHTLFDFYGGSSAGALAISGILLSEDGMNAKHTALDLHDLLLKNITQCFTWSYYSYMSSLFGLLGPKYTNTGLNAVIDSFCLNYQMKHLLKPVIFPSYDRISNKSYYFDHKDSDLSLKNILLACSAAPLVFSSHRMKINERDYNLIDSGIVSNNPVGLTYLKATQNIKVLDKSKILLLNIGTGYFPKSASDGQGLAGWASQIVDTLMSANEENEMYELSLKLPEENYFILDVPLDVKYYQMDNTSPEAVEHYLTRTELWINENQEKIKAFCDKLVANKN